MSSASSCSMDEDTVCRPISKGSSTMKHSVVIDPKQVLEGHKEGKKVADFLERGGVPSLPQRRLLVRLTVQSLIDKRGGDLYPTSAQKTALAKAIVRAYPVTKDTTPGLQGHEHFYDEGKGFIEYRLKTVRSAKSDEEKRHFQKKPKNKHPRIDDLSCAVDQPVNDFNDEDMSEKVNIMKFTSPVSTNQGKIRKLFRETYSFRRQEVNSMTITEFLSLYPRVKDMPDLIDLEFELMYNTCSSNFVAKWGTFFKPRILSLVAQEGSSAVKDLREVYEGGDSDLCALVMLIYLTYRSASNSKKSKGPERAASRSEAVKYFIQHVPDGTDVESTVNDKAAKYRQPYLLAIGPSVKPTQYFLVLDKTPVSGGLQIVEAVDRLFKCHYVFSVEYASPLHDFWEFLDAMVYGVKNPAGALPNVRALASSLRALNSV